jgi:hypothetical protein
MVKLPYPRAYALPHISPPPVVAGSSLLIAGVLHAVDQYVIPPWLTRRHCLRCLARCAIFLILLLAYNSAASIVVKGVGEGGC